MKAQLLLFSATLLIIAGNVEAQQKLNIKFGNVTPEDFKTTVYSIDSNANAITIADIGSTEIIGNNKGTFSLLFKRFRRARVLNKNGFDIGDVQINLYTNSQGEEELENLKAVSYNLENGKIVETKLDVKTSLFKDKINANWVTKKFTFPNLKEGTIIDLEYRIKSDFIFNLQPWEFQGKYPRLWSEYNVAMPSFYNYVTLTQGYVPYHIREASAHTSSFYWSDSRGSGASENATITSRVTDYRWVMKDVMALKEESYTSTLNNHIAKIEFQLSSIGEPFTFKQIMSSYQVASKELMQDEDFGATLKKDNPWLKDVMDEIVGSAATKTEKAKKIFGWVRDNFTCTSKSGKYIQQPLKTVLKNKSGNVGEINLLLTAMLLKAGINASPVILSTRSHGYANALYPLMDRFNYVISFIEIEGKEYYLDATEPGQAFGRLGYEIYNGHARIINEEATPVQFEASTIKETKNTLVLMVNDESGKYLGTVQQSPGYFESLDLRQDIKEKGKERFSAALQKNLGDDFKVTAVNIDSLSKYDEPIAIQYNIEFKQPEEPILYFNPMLGEGFSDNPFKSINRLYPVEMPYTIDEMFNLRMEIPKGYVVDELPKSMLIKFNDEGDAVYEYRISSSAADISFRSRLMVKKAFFIPEDYEVLREFFAMIVKKQNEQIVFKKKP